MLSALALPLTWFHVEGVKAGERFLHRGSL